MASKNDIKHIPHPTEVVWNWKAREQNGHHSNAELRKKGILPITLTLIIASLFRFYFEWYHSATVVYSFCAFFVLVTLFLPGWLLKIEQFMLTFGKWVGTLLTWILLLPFFFVAFVPLRLIQIISKSDPLKKRYDASLQSYWLERELKNQRSNIDKQY